MGLSYDVILLSPEALEKFHTPIKSALCSTYGAYICTTLMGLGISCVTQETLKEIKKRDKLQSVICDLDGHSRIPWKEFIGLSTNVAYETRFQFISRLLKYNKENFTKREFSQLKEALWKEQDAKRKSQTQSA